MRLKLWFIDSQSTTRPKRRVAAMRLIVAQTAEKHALRPEDILSPLVGRRIAHARQEAYFRARADLDQSLPSIGQFFGRDHTTILHGVRAHAARMAAQ